MGLARADAAEESVARWREGPPQPKAHHEGTHRVRPPGETMTWALERGRKVGVTRVADVTGLDDIGLPVVMVCRPNARALTVAQGKGVRLEDAVVSGVMESIEGYHGERVAGPLLRASYEAMCQDHVVVDPRQLAQPTHARFDPRRPVYWIEGYDLVGDEPVWVPFEAVHTDFTLDRNPEYCGLMRSTNGLASGNTMLEAIGHGLFEVIERDARRLQELRDPAALDRRRIDLASLVGDVPRRLLDRFLDAGLAVALWDATCDTGIATVHCVVVDAVGNPWRQMYAVAGWGTHVSREVAASRAMTEAVQSRLTLIAGARDDMPASVYDRATDPAFVDEVRATVLRATNPVPLASLPDDAQDTIGGDVELVLGRLRAAGITRAVAVDLRMPSVGVPVVKLVVPGLEAGMPGARLGRRGGMLAVQGA